MLVHNAAIIAEDIILSYFNCDIILPQITEISAHCKDGAHGGASGAVDEIFA